MDSTQVIIPCGPTKKLCQASEFVAFGSKGAAMINGDRHWYLHRLVTTTSDAGENSEKIALPPNERPSEKRHYKAVTDSMLAVQQGAGNPTYQYGWRDNRLLPRGTINQEGKLIGSLDNDLVFCVRRSVNEYILVVALAHGEMILEPPCDVTWSHGLSVCITGGQYIVVVECNSRSMDVFSTSGAHIAHKHLAYRPQCYSGISAYGPNFVIVASSHGAESTHERLLIHQLPNGERVREVPYCEIGLREDEFVGALRWIEPDLLCVAVKIKSYTDTLRVYKLWPESSINTFTWSSAGEESGERTDGRLPNHDTLECDAEVENEEGPDRIGGAHDWRKVALEFSNKTCTPKDSSDAVVFTDYGAAMITTSSAILVLQPSGTIGPYTLEIPLPKDMLQRTQFCFKGITSSALFIQDQEHYETFVFSTNNGCQQKSLHHKGTLLAALGEGLAYAVDRHDASPYDYIIEVHTGTDTDSLKPPQDTIWQDSSLAVCQTESYIVVTSTTSQTMHLFSRTGDHLKMIKLDYQPHDASSAIVSCGPDVVVVLGWLPNILYVHQLPSGKMLRRINPMHLDLGKDLTIAGVNYSDRGFLNVAVKYVTNIKALHCYKIGKNSPSDSGDLNGANTTQDPDECPVAEMSQMTMKDNLS